MAGLIANLTAGLTAGLPAFVITLREGVEAALVVGIVLAALSKKGRSQALNRYVYQGIAAGIAASIGVGIGLNGLLLSLSRSQQSYAPALQQGLQTGFGIVAIGLLSWMLIWMTQQAKSLKGEIEGAVGQQLAAEAKLGEEVTLGTESGDQSGDQSISLAGRGIFSLIFLAVLREGFETVIFLAAQFQEGWIPAVGAIVGLVGATAIGVGFFKLGVRINLKQFFQVMGVFLLLIVGGLVVGTLSHGDRAFLAMAKISPTVADWCGDTQTCWLGSQVWDLSESLSDRAFPGIVLKTLLGYRDKIYLVQAIGWVSFIGGVGGLYFRTLNPKSGMTLQTDKRVEEVS